MQKYVSLIYLYLFFSLCFSIVLKRIFKFQWLNLKFNISRKNVEITVFLLHSSYIILRHFRAFLGKKYFFFAFVPFFDITTKTQFYFLLNFCMNFEIEHAKKGEVYFF